MLFFWLLILQFCTDIYCYETAFILTDTKCITNSTRALVNNATYIDISMTPKASTFIEEEYPKLKCKFDGNEGCEKYWENRNWRIVDSIDQINETEIITDRRWEEFQTYTTEYVSGGLLQYQSVMQLRQKQFRVPISIRTKEAHIFLCKGSAPPNNHCIWFLLQAWKGKKSGVRECESAMIPSKDGTFPSGYCSNVRNEIFHPTDFEPFLNDEFWAHFIIEKDEEKYKIIVNDEIFLHYETSVRDLNYLIVHSKQTNGFWKIHRYRYLYSDSESETQLGPTIDFSSTTCVSMFVKMCEWCTMEIFVKGEYGAVWLSNIYKEQKWQEIKIFVENFYENGYLYVKTSVTQRNRGFWAIDDFRRCKEVEYRVIDKNVEESCELLSTESLLPNGNVGDENSSCAENEIGKYCIPCTSLFGTETCPPTKYCELNPKNDCYCSAGFMGRTCTSDCKDKTYGHQCQKLCSFCKDGCDPITGVCRSQDCLKNYMGPKCDKEKFALLNVPPTISNIDYNSAIVIVNDFSYKGPTPKYFEIQYKEISSTNWINISRQTFKDVYKSPLTKLQADTSYEIRAVLIEKGTDDTDQDDNLVPKTNFSTLCDDIIDSDIKVNPTNTSATITIETTSESCHLNNYEIFPKNWQQQQNLFQAYDLKPYSEYNFTLRHIRTNNTITKLFRTLSGTPEKVENLTIIDINSTIIKLKWDEPTVTNGDIKSYTVILKFIRHSACDFSNNHTEKETHAIEKYVEMNYANVFSLYQVSVYARTEDMSGEIEVINVFTPEGPLSSQELPTITDLTSTSSSINLMYEALDCTNLKGKIIINGTLNSDREWCPSSFVNKTLKTMRTSFKINALQPYCRYSINLTFCRNETCMGSFVQTVETLPADPSIVRDVLVTSKGDNFISLRWLPPYPPRCLLKQYKIYYYYSSWSRTYSYQSSISNNSSCTLWPNYICSTIRNEVYEGYRYNIKVTAVCKNYKESEPTYELNTKAKESYPESPYGQNFIWDDNYKLSVQWYHPNVTNGVLRRFVIKIKCGNNPSIQQKKFVSEKDYQLNYNLEINKMCENNVIEAAVSACTSTGCSSDAKTTDSTPPPDPPKFVNDASQDTFWKSDNYTINVSLPALPNNNNYKTFIFIEAIGLNKNVTPREEVSSVERLLIKGIKNLTDYNIIGEIKITKLPTDYTIGDNSTTKSKFLNRTIFNPKLSPGKYYNINVLIINVYENKNVTAIETITTYTMGNPEFDELNKKPKNGLYAILILIPIIAGLIYLYIRYKKQKSSKGSSEHILYSKQTESNELTTAPSKIKIKPPVPTKPQQKNEAEKHDIDTNKNQKSVKRKIDGHSKLIKIADLEEYIKNAANGELERQHELFPRGQTQPWDYAALKVNKVKNRYNNLLAYDHSRVILKKINGDEYSDYINANYIDGYNTPRAYIATQGPKAATLNDFWRMIWQENVKTIVMMANVFEDNKKKVEKYWPAINENLTFGNITVTYVSSKVFANYEYRIFNAICNNEKRKIEQLHFTVWPDHGVPFYPESLVPFLRKLLTIKIDSKSPVVVHCSAGVGRTGTIILCDICLRMAAAEGQVDMLNTLDLMRRQRPNMVDNIQQYTLAHMVLLESLLGMRTNIPCDDRMEAVIEDVLQNKITSQMRYLDDTKWQDQAMLSLNGSIETNIICKEKNRFSHIIPEKQGQLFLSRYPIDDEFSSYINAILVDGFCNRNRYIVTQQPMPNTLADFWRLVIEYNCTVILSLNEINPKDETSCQFWPNDATKIYPIENFLSVEHVETKNFQFYDVISTTVTLEENDVSVNVDIIKVKNWHCNQTLPRNLEEFLLFIEESDAVLRKSVPLVVTCYDGATASGLYLALTFLIEKMKLEHECDVCQAVRNIRHHRKQFVTDQEQFAFLYRASLAYINKFQSYANFA